MSLKEDIANSAQWLDACYSLVDSQPLSDCTRNRISAALLHLALGHHEAIQVLVSYEPSPLNGSAAALLRPQFEAYVRGAWYHRCASEQDLEQFIKGNKPPKINKLISDLETISCFEENKFREVKDFVWNPMCDLTHGGISQVASRNSSSEITENYTDKQVREILHGASSVTLTTSVELAIVLNNNAIAKELLSTYQSFF